MKLIDCITDNAVQEFILQVEDFGRVKIRLTYMETQLGWFMDIDAGIKIINGIRVVNSLNMIRNWQYVFGFGLAVQTDDGEDPKTIDAFSSGYAVMTLLSADDVAEINDVYLQ